MYLSCDSDSARTLPDDDDRAQKHGNVIYKIIARMTETTKEYFASRVIYLRVYVLSVYECIQAYAQVRYYINVIVLRSVVQYRHFD